MKLSKLKELRGNTNKIAYGFAAMSVLGTYLALSGTKYPTRNFCFKPEIIYNASDPFNQNYCKSGQTIYTTHPKFLLSRDQDAPNSAFVFGETKFLIPAKGRVDKSFNYPSNPGYMWYALTASGLSIAAYSLYSTSLKRYAYDFPRYFEQVKTFTLSEQLDGSQSRLIKKVQNDLDIKYIVDKQTREFQIMQTLEMSESEILELQSAAKVDADKQSELSDYQYRLQLSELAKAKVENDLAIAKALKEKEKIEGKKQDSKKADSVEDVRKQLMIEKLKEWEDGYLMKLIEFRKPMYIYGGMGSGKSTLASAIILIRHFLFDCPLETIIDAHAQVNTLEAWQPLMEVFGEDLKIVGHNNDYQAIAKAFNDSIDRWAEKMPKFKKGEIGKSQMLVDEMSNLSDKDACSLEAASFSKQALSDPRKAGEYVMVLTHMMTQTGTGNKGGTSKARNTQTIQIERKSANGEIPIPNVIINGLPDENGDMNEFNATIPDWMRAEKILDFFKNGTNIFDKSETIEDSLDKLDPWFDKK
jgi:hypothetical protein